MSQSKANATMTADDAYQVIDNLLRRAEKGDKSSLPALRGCFDRHPEVWEPIGNLAHQVEASLIEKASGKNLLLKEALPRKLAAMKTELAGQQPTPLEKLLVERVTACWAQLQYADAIYIQNMGDLTMAQAEYHQRRIDRCHHRYLSAIRTLAMVRRLLRPAVAQINIAEQQVNVAS